MELDDRRDTMSDADPTESPVILTPIALKSENECELKEQPKLKA